MKFTEFTLHDDLQKGIAATGYVDCTPVQEQVLKVALEGDDLYVQSQTGTGKTAAYLIPIIQEMLSRPDADGKKALIMVPTRELAVQVEQEAKTLLSETKLKAYSFYGGVGYTQQTTALKKGVDFIVGTPGRVIDLQESGDMDLSTVAFLVVDEADRMFDMGFYPDLRKLIKVLPKSDQRQTMLFSATLNTYVKNLAWEYTVDAKEITIEAEQITVEEIDQQLLHVSSDSKMKLLLGILQSEKPESVIVFCNTKRSCEVVAKRLQLNGIESEFIIGDLPQSKRLQVLDSFKNGSLKCLVATDVAARGIDVNDLAMVVNYDLPNETENYVHRIGRTARAGKSGKAYTFCSEQDVYNLPPIERYLGSAIPSAVAFDDMLAEDKSEGTYIRTGDYGDDDERDGRNDRRNERRNHGRGDSRRNGSGYKSTSGGKTGGSRYNDGGKRSANGEGYKGSKPHYRQNQSYGNREATETSAEFDKKLAAMSFEERMKLYKEKYGGNQNTSSAKGGKRHGSGKGGKYPQKGKRYDNRNVNKQGSVNSKKAADNKAAAPKSAQKKGIFARIKGLFGKNKDK